MSHDIKTSNLRFWPKSKADLLQLPLIMEPLPKAFRYKKKTESFSEIQPPTLTSSLVIKVCDHETIIRKRFFMSCEGWNHRPRSGISLDDNNLETWLGNNFPGELTAMTQEIMEFLVQMLWPFCVAADSSEISGQGQQWPQRHSHEHRWRDQLDLVGELLPMLSKQQFWQVARPAARRLETAMLWPSFSEDQIWICYKYFGHMRWTYATSSVRSRKSAFYFRAGLFV